jgi:glycosyltransferase involved in cell wall biosynthesis
MPPRPSYQDNPCVIHLVNPLWNAAGGSEWHTIELYRELSPHTEVKLWTEHQPDPAFASAWPIQRIDADGGHIPRGGTLVFVGVYQLPGSWVKAAAPRRAIVLYNTLHPQQLVRFMRQLFDAQIQRVEVVFSSEEQRKQTKLRGIVEYSYIDLKRFVPRTGGGGNQREGLVVGRLSRDDPRKHHPDDLRLYNELVGFGHHVRVMGGTCLQQTGPIPSGVELIPTKTEPAEVFLQGLDCFFYRTGDRWWEPFGRVVFEAMACGLPLVCHRRGGYLANIDHGRNGFLFDTNADALDILRRLAADPTLRATIGQAARATVEDMYSPAERAKVVNYYLM